jgi:nucleoside triphosphatase
MDKDLKKKEYPEVTVGALIFNAKQQIFLMKSPKWKNRYVVQGGHIELGETVEQALKREIKEETNLEIKDIRFIGMLESVFSEEFHKKKHFIFLDFSCKALSSDVRLNEEATEFIWVTLEEALKIDVEPFTIQTIKNYIKGSKAR